MSNVRTISGSSTLRVGVVGIFIHQSDSVERVNHILKDFSHLFKGRLGVPRICHTPPVNVIALIFTGSTDELGAFSGRMGQIPGVEVKSLISRNCVPGSTEER